MNRKAADRGGEGRDKGVAKRGKGKRRDIFSNADIPDSGRFLVGSASHGNSSRQRSDTDDDAGK